MFIIQDNEFILLVLRSLLIAMLYKYILINVESYIDCCSPSLCDRLVLMPFSDTNHGPVIFIVNHLVTL